jgi:hypothetical protein
MYEVNQERCSRKRGNAATGLNLLIRYNSSRGSFGVTVKGNYYWEELKPEQNGSRWLNMNNAFTSGM